MALTACSVIIANVIVIVIISIPVVPLRLVHLVGKEGVGRAPVPGGRRCAGSLDLKFTRKTRQAATSESQKLAALSQHATVGRGVEAGAEMANKTNCTHHGNRAVQGGHRWLLGRHHAGGGDERHGGKLGKGDFHCRYYVKVCINFSFVTNGGGTESASLLMASKFDLCHCLERYQWKWPRIQAASHPATWVVLVLSSHTRQ